MYFLFSSIKRKELLKSYNYAFIMTDPAFTSLLSMYTENVVNTIEDWFHNFGQNNS